MPVVIVDGQEVEIGASERLNGIQAARRAGVEIPHYCWHAGLSVVASCRMCLVELKGAPKPVASCAWGVRDCLPGPNGERHYQVHASDEQRMSVMCLDCGQLTTLKTEMDGPLNAAVRDLGFNAQSLRVTMAAHCDHVCGRKVEEK